MRVWITKYALTAGICERDVRELAEDGRHVFVSEDGALNGWAMYHGNDWHETREDAVACAEEMRTAKIASLKKSIAKLEKLTFVRATRDPG